MDQTDDLMQLRAALQHARMILREQERQLNAVRAFAQMTATKMEQEFAAISAGGVPRGEYTWRRAYASGAGKCAEGVLKIIG